MRHNFWIIVAIALGLSGCYSYKIYPKEVLHFSYVGTKQTAFVINPELEKEYNILVKANIFNITTDSLDPSAIKVQLFPIEKRLACGQGAVVTVFSLGQLPSLMPDRYMYRFKEIYPNDSQMQRFELHLATRYWFWDIFIFNKRFDSKAGQILSAQYFSGYPGHVTGVTAE